MGRARMYGCPGCGWTGTDSRDSGTGSALAWETRLCTRERRWVTVLRVPAGTGHARGTALLGKCPLHRTAACLAGIGDRCPRCGERLDEEGAVNTH